MMTREDFLTFGGPLFRTRLQGQLPNDPPKPPPVLDLDHWLFEDEG